MSKLSLTHARKRLTGIRKIHAHAFDRRERRADTVQRVTPTYELLGDRIKSGFNISDDQGHIRKLSALCERDQRLARKAADNFSPCLRRSRAAAQTAKVVPIENERIRWAVVAGCKQNKSAHRQRGQRPFNGRLGFRPGQTVVAIVAARRDILEKRYLAHSLAPFSV